LIQGHIGSTDINQQYDISRDLPTVKKYFEDLLRIYGYIDFGMLFFIDTEKDFKDVFETGFAEYAEKLKKDGYIRHIGFSSHNPETAVKAINTGLPEIMMFSINPAFDMLPYDKYVVDYFDAGVDSDLLKGLDPKRAALYKLCSQKQVGITVMKALGAAKLISPEHTPFAKPLTVAQCVHYALSRPAVSSVILGPRTAKEVNEGIEYFDTTDEERDYTEILSGERNDFTGSCVYCSHCLPCPAGIDIASVSKYLDIARLDTKNIPPSVKSHYMNLLHKGCECTKCGSCEERCPFDVPVIENMREAELLLKLH
jgi:hypothetical protein